MTIPAPTPAPPAGNRSTIAVPLTAVAFVMCFAATLRGLVDAWLTIPDAAHGILIAPVAVWLAWRAGLLSDRHPAPWGGSLVVAFGVVLCVLGRAAGVATVPRVGLLVVVAGLVIWYAGLRQVLAWWLPLVLLALTVPLPESIIAAVTMPLQAVAASMGAALLRWRHIPVLLSGNVIALPGHTLFVSEACSGLRSLTALVSMAILIGALFLRSAVSRLLMLVAAVVLAIVVNGIRVFLTGFLVFFVNPALGEGFMHLTEGYLLFLVSLSILATVTWVFMRLERLGQRPHSEETV